MKKFVLAFVAALGIVASGSAAAAGHAPFKTGLAGLNITLADATSAITDSYMINGKYFLSSDMAVTGGAGIGFLGADGTGTDIGVRMGVRKYLKAATFAPFMGGYVSYSETSNSTLKELAILGEFGAEYFLDDQFSIEGSARAGYGSTNVANVHVTKVGTFGASLSVNYYF